MIIFIPGTHPVPIILGIADGIHPGTTVGIHPGTTVVTIGDIPDCGAGTIGVIIPGTITTMDMAGATVGTTTTITGADVLLATLVTPIMAGVKTAVA